MSAPNIHTTQERHEQLLGVVALLRRAMELAQQNVEIGVCALQKRQSKEVGSLAKAAARMAKDAGRW